MRRGRIFLFLILIVVVGLALLYLAYTQFLSGGATPTAAAPLTQVYYAAQNIPQGTTITQEMLDTFSLPPENVAAVMFTVGEENALVGQVARFDLDQGVIITSSMVGTAPEIAGPPWAVNIPAGMVAAAIPTNRLSLMGYGVADGARVNVNACMLFVDVDPAFQTVLPNFTSLVTGTGFIESQLPVLSAVAAVTAEDGTHPTRQGRIELESTLQQPLYVVPGEAQRPRLVCQMILQDVLVLKVGNFVAQTPAATDPNATPSPVQAQQQANPDLVTLVVNPQDSISLNYFVYSGAMLSLSLRRTDDSSRFNAESATLTSLLTQYNISLPSKLPYATQPRLDVLNPPVLPNDAVTVQPQQQ